MKKKRVFSLFVLLLLVGIAGVFVAGTYAKYTSKVSKSATLSVAKWAFDSDNPDGELAINLYGTVDESTLKQFDSDGNRLIAPGTEGNFNIEISNKNSEVGVDFNLSFKDSENIPNNLVIKQGTNIIEHNGSIKGKIKAGESIKIPFQWAWTYSANDVDDKEDTTDGINGNTMNLTANIKGTQVSPGAIITTGLTN